MLAVGISQSIKAYYGATDRWKRKKTQRVKQFQLALSCRGREIEGKRDLLWEMKWWWVRVRERKNLVTPGIEPEPATSTLPLCLYQWPLHLQHITASTQEQAFKTATDIFIGHGNRQMLRWVQVHQPGSVVASLDGPGFADVESRPLGVVALRMVDGQETDQVNSLSQELDDWHRFANLRNGVTSLKHLKRSKFNYFVIM